MLPDSMIADVELSVSVVNTNACGSLEELSLSTKMD